jgi:uncharacterized membrane protein YsdA (DUF1294 family)/cold shock CspA family protein
MLISGELVQWNNKSGFGFIRDGAGNDFYLHISAMADTTRPKLGDRLQFEVTKGRKGRPSAQKVVIVSSAPFQVETPGAASNDNVAWNRVGLRVTIACLLTLLLTWALAEAQLSAWIFGLYIVMSIVSALLYRFDKLYALEGRYRVSETTLHLVDLAGGIIGGLIAQELYRHKTIKPRFVATTWTISLLHVLGLAGFALGGFATIATAVGL